MNKYLKISNNGLIEKEDMTLIGSSTKRGDDSKIGQYGSGNKFWLSYALRNDMLPTIYRGEHILPIDYKIVLHRDAPVRVLVVDGQETSITAGMGELDWKCWMALREVVCNAIDEGDMKLDTIFGDESIKGEKDRTSIYIPITGELTQVLMEFDKYFAFEREVVYENLIAKVYERTESAPTSVYRKGVRCLDSEVKTTLDFNFHDIGINESRVTDTYKFRNEMKKFMRSCASSKIFFKVLKEFSHDYLHDNLDDIQIGMFKQKVEDEFEIKPKFMQDIAGMLGTGGGNVIVIPNRWFEQLKDAGIVSDMFKKLDGESSFMELNNLNCREIEYHMKEVNCRHTVKSGILSQGRMMIKDNIIYLSEKEYNVKQNPQDICASILYSMSESELRDLFSN